MKNIVRFLSICFFFTSIYGIIDTGGYKNVAKLQITDCSNVEQKIDSVFGSSSIEEPTVNKGKHISCENDSTMGSVLQFRLFKNDDDSVTQDSTKQRLEMKVSEKSREDLKAKKGSRYIYSWFFKLGANLKVSSEFFHIFQLKAKGNGVDDHPVAAFTLTRQDGLHLRIRRDDQSTVDYFKMLELNAVRGQWIQAMVEVLYNSGKTAASPNSGYVKVVLKDASGKQLYPTNAKDGIVYNNMYWNNVQFVRPKWGLYRRRSSVFGQSDTEQFQNVEIWKK